MIDETDSASESLLEQQITLRRREIFTEMLSMSVGELTTMYADGDLIIQPEFQRLFRWDETQKSSLVESILLGIPVPSIFVSTTTDGRWELIDGLQRVSTLLQLQGLLKSPEGVKQPQLQLRATNYLSALEGKVWEAVLPGDDALGPVEKRDIRRARIDVQIIKRESTARAKYDLFQRLNSFGSPLTAQEIRGALIVSVNPHLLRWLTDLVNLDSFKLCTPLTDRQMQEQYNFELALRFLILHNRENFRPRELRNFSSFLDDETMVLAENFMERREPLEHTFVRTFSKIAAGPAEDAFRRWVPEKNKYSGGFSNTAFEVIALGLGYHIARGHTPTIEVEEAVKVVWTTDLIPPNFATGRSSEDRISTLLPIGRTLFDL
ncbi:MULTISPECIES: DUF262 domain-containing protein [Mycobacterium avium complex (MAC)]|uniref:GmrSD restriction endonucleases N-terminal domain-containing protein n=1 Tax=Mycobacterium marseillense TaxID=701042 RepID=A0ABN6A166_9MYCO|nr:MULTISPECIES: DUF262 domain-containing protein [Mycobacterium avium complex (MAC)]BBY13531.1 hypothetical protein MMARJ_42710 [Mycobacterium marseillense]BCP03368.1 hypothetical protein MINTM019_08240 [Mycobacterium paraintracellulare]